MKNLNRVPVTIEDELALRQILIMLEAVGATFSTISPALRDELNKTHNEGYSLAHCLRWGEQAVRDTIDTIENN
jgi:hypothetical protein